MGVISSSANSAVKSARKLARRRERVRADEFLVEGPQAVREAHSHLRRLFVTERAAAREKALLERVRGCGAQILLVADDVLNGLASTVSPQGLVGVATLPDSDLETVLDHASLLVVCWQVSDPGNVGSILRSSDAAGVDAVVVTAGSVDVRNPKAVRASAGSLFHLPVVDDVTFEAVAAGCRARGIRLVAASAHGTVDYLQVDLNAPTALVFGSEAHGLDDKVAAACDAVARVPLHRGPRAGYAGHAQSLNLAATVAVLAYEAARQRRAPATPTPW